MKKIIYSLCMICFFSCQSQKTELPYFNSADFKPEWIKPSDDLFEKIHTIDAFSLTDQEGRTVTNEDFKNKIYIADFFFTTCPGICPEMTKNMYILQERFKTNERIKLISHSVTPWIDTVQQLKRYAIENDVNSEKWHLVTGETENIYELARNSYFAEREIGLQLTVDDFLHTENFLLIDQNSRIRGIYNGTLTSDIDRLIEDIHMLLR